MDSIPHTLLIVGKKSGFISGDMNLIKKANTFGERVVMTGFLSDDKLQSYYSHADLFVFPIRNGGNEMPHAYNQVGAIDQGGDDLHPGHWRVVEYCGPGLEPHPALGQGAG